MPLNLTPSLYTRARPLSSPRTTRNLSIRFRSADFQVRSEPLRLTRSPCQSSRLGIRCQAVELLGFTRNPFALLRIQFRSEPRRLAFFPLSLADPFPLVKPSNYRESFDSLSLDLAFRSSGLPLRLTASTPSSYRTLFPLSSPETIRFSRKHKEARRLRDAQGTRLVVKEPLACRFRLTNTLTIPRADSPVNTRNH